MTRFCTKQSSDYFSSHHLDESDVYKFSYSESDSQVMLIIFSAHEFNTMSESERKRYSKIDSSKFSHFEELHKIEFQGVTKFKRTGNICSKFDKNHSYQHDVKKNPIILLYNIDDTIHGNSRKFSASFSEFGDISFIYNELSVEIRKVLEKSEDGHNYDQLFFDVKSGKVGHILELFEPESLKVGDTVQLKSGGPSMTIVSSQNKKGVFHFTCNWFDENKNFKSKIFPNGVLVPTERLKQSKLQTA